MGVIAWIVLGLSAGLLANMLVPGRRSQGLGSRSGQRSRSWTHR